MAKESSETFFNEQDKIEVRREAMISGLKAQLDTPETEKRKLLHLFVVLLTFRYIVEPNY